MQAKRANSAVARTGSAAASQPEGGAMAVLAENVMIGWPR